jgi:hypothetical protein
VSQYLQETRQFLCGQNGGPDACLPSTAAAPPSNQLRRATSSAEQPAPPLAMQWPSRKRELTPTTCHCKAPPIHPLVQQEGRWAAFSKPHISQRVHLPCLFNRDHPPGPLTHSPHPPRPPTAGLLPQAAPPAGPGPQRHAGSRGLYSSAGRICASSCIVLIQVVL